MPKIEQGEGFSTNQKEKNWKEKTNRQQMMKNIM